MYTIYILWKILENQTQNVKFVASQYIEGHLPLSRMEKIYIVLNNVCLKTENKY